MTTTVAPDPPDGSQPPIVQRRRRARGSLSRGEIAAAARDLAAHNGLARLSMPTLAARLGCGVMSIYRHFENKDDLLAAVADQVMRDLHRRLPPAGEGPWRDELITYFTAYRDLMESFPVYREVVLYAPAFVIRAALTPAQLRRLDTGIGLLRRAGLPLADAAAVYNACFNYTRSYVAFEHAAHSAAPAAAPPAHHLPPADYPQLSQLPDVDAVLGIDERGFRLGLRLLAEGIAAHYHAADR